jgi:hypothetical protein
MENKERRIIAMKIIKTVLIALIVGIVCIGTGFLKLENIAVSKIILSNTFAGIDYYPQYISMFTFQYMPLFAFQIFFATYIYKHFCSASIYYFSRNINRVNWFLKEVAKMYANVIIYLIVMCATEMAVIMIFSTIKIDNSAAIISFYYICIYSLYLLATTLAINVFSIILGSNMGFVTVQSVILLAISIFFLLGNYVKDDIITEKFSLILKSNIIANLIFSIHSSGIEKINNLINIKGIEFDLNFSIAYYLVMCIAVIILGCYVVEKHEFITNSKE